MYTMESSLTGIHIFRSSAVTTLCICKRNIAIHLPLVIVLSTFWINKLLLFPKHCQSFFQTDSSWKKFLADVRSS